MDKEDLKRGIERLYTQNLGVKPGETVLIFTDRVSPEENIPQDQMDKRGDLLDIFRLMGVSAPAGVNIKEVVFDATGGHGREPPEALWIAAFGLEVVERLKKEELWNGLLSKSLDNVALERVERILMDFKSECPGVIIGNLPAGEVFMPPESGTANGELVLEFAPTWQLGKPVTLIIEKGEVVRVSGNDPYAGELEDFLERDQNYRNIAELGIGTNDRATRPDNILESEKILGTIHIALGDNSSFGGQVRTSFHQDFVVFHPTLTLLYPGGKRENFLVRGQLKDVFKD